MNWLKRLWQKLFGPKQDVEQGVSPHEPVTIIPKGEATNPLPDGASISKSEGKPEWNAPWVFQDIDILGSKEDSRELAKRLAPFWRRLGLSFANLIGTSHAWCALRVNYALDKAGVKGSGSAGASSFQKWGKGCQYYFGAILPITHSNGNHHVNLFLYWHDEAKKIACTMDGNRNNEFGIFLTDLSGKGDRVVPGPRWPLGVPDGVFKTKAEVLAVYSWMKPGSSGTGGSTR